MGGFISGSGVPGGAPLQPFTPQPQFSNNAPRCVAVINGSRYLPTAATIAQKAHGSTDTATVTLPIGNNPDFTVELFRGVSPGPLPVDTSNDPVRAQIWWGFPPNTMPGSTDITGMVLMFDGLVDIYNPKFAANEVVFTCRSLAAPLITDRLTRVSMNETSLQFAQQCATYAGLSLVTNLPTAPITVQEALGNELVTPYSLNSSLYGMHYWDLLINLALFDDVDVWVDGSTLYYAAPSLISRNTVPLIYGRDFLVEDGLEGTHAVQFNKNIKIVVKSYTPRIRKTTTTHLTTNGDGSYTVRQRTANAVSTTDFASQTITNYTTDSNGSVSVSKTQVSGGSYTGNTSIVSDSGVQRYPFWLPNATPEMANAFAKSAWRDISQHEYSLTGKVSVTPQFLSQFKRTSLLAISGTPYKLFNTGAGGSPPYYPRQVDWEFTLESGFDCSITSVNHILASSEV